MRYSDLDRLISGKNFVIAVDFDDTLVETTEYPYFGQTTEMFHKLLRIQKEFPNTQFILYTCREGKDLDMAVKFLETNGFRIDAVNGFIKVLKIKPEGKNEMDARSFFNGAGRNLVNVKTRETYE